MRKTSKIKRILAGLLALLLTVALMPAQTARIAKADPTIDPDPDKKGSLTIHKYEYNGAGGSTGTGASTDTVPAGATPLDGVKFKVTYVAKLDAYYGTDGEPLISLANAQSISSGSTILNDVTASHFTPNVGEYMTVITTSGVATLSDLPLGLYLVQETEHPSQITGPVEDFLVSIPMTNATEDDWLYDVHVFPKNKSTYGNVYLLKQKQFGSNSAEPFSGVGFKLQLYNTVTDNWETIKDAGGSSDRLFTTDGDGKIEVNNLAPGKYRFVEISVPNDTGYIMDGATTYEFEVKTDGKAYQKDGGGNFSVEVTVGNAITVTNYKPDLVKKVDKTGSGDWQDAADYSVGDTIPFLITVDVPANVGLLTTFSLTDTYQNMTINSGTLKIYDSTDHSTEILAGKYTSNVDNTNHKWTITFNDIATDDDGIKSKAGEKIYIYYEAELTENAINTSAGNLNTATLEYSHEIIPTTDPDNPNTGSTPHEDSISDQAVVYTFKIEVTKVDESSNPLENVQFDLYQKLADDATGTGVLTDPVKGLTGKYKKIKEGLSTDNNGKISVNGLENGTYYLVETKTKDGYNLLKEPVEVTINVSYSTTTSTTTTTTDGVTTTETVVTNNTFTGGDGDTGVYTITIKNNKGFTLPTTGGIGSAIFVFVGVSMMVAAVILFFVSRKKENDKTKP